MDTVEDFLRILQPEQLEVIKAALVTGLIGQKVLRHFRVLGKYYTVGIDGTGANSYTAEDARLQNFLTASQSIAQYHLKNKNN